MFEDFTKEYQDCNILKMYCGTNCPQGGDAGHGGVTKFEILDEGNTAFKIKYKNHPKGKWQDMENVYNARLVLFGDSEARTFIKALEDAAKFLRKQINEE